MKRATRLRKRVLLFMSCFSVTILLVEHGSWRARSARQRQQGIPQARAAAPMQAKQHVLEHADALKPSAKIYPAGRCNQRRCAPAALLLRLQPLTAMRNDQWPDDIRLSDLMLSRASPAKLAAPRALTSARISTRRPGKPASARKPQAHRNDQPNPGLARGTTLFRSA